MFFMRATTKLGILSTLPLLCLAISASRVYAQAETESNNSFATANTLTGTNSFAGTGTVSQSFTTGAGGHASDTDFFKFTPTVSGSYAFSLVSPAGSNLDPTLYVYNAAQTLIAYNDDATASNFNSGIPSLSLTAGQQYFAVADSSPLQHTGPAAFDPNASETALGTGTLGTGTATGSYTLTITGPAATGVVPEPGTCALLASGLLPLAGTYPSASTPHGRDSFTSSRPRVPTS